MMILFIALSTNKDLLICTQGHINVQNMISSLKELVITMLGKEDIRWRVRMKVIYMSFMMYINIIKDNVCEGSVEAGIV